MNRNMEQMGFKQGLAEDALLTALSRFIIFVFVPLVAIEYLTGMVAHSSDPDRYLVVFYLGQLSYLPLVFGIPLTIVSFLWDYHLRQTKARLVLGVINVFILLLYAAVFLTCAPTRDILSMMGWMLDWPETLGVIAFLGLLNCLRYYRDYVIFSGMAAKAAGAAAPPPMVPRPGRQEFDLRTGDMARGVKGAMRSITRTTLPLAGSILALTFLLSFIGIGRDLMDGTILDILDEMCGVVLLFSIPIVLFSYFKGYYAKGSLPRMVFDLCVSLTIGLMVLGMFTLTDLDLALQASGVRFPTLAVGLTISIWALIDALRALGEFRETRPERLAALGEESLVRKKPCRWNGKWSSEFDTARCSLTAGLISSRKAFLRFVTIPELLILVGISILQSAGASGYIIDILAGWNSVVLLFGLMLCIIAFPMGYYPQGSIPRLCFGMALVPALLVYLLGIFEWGKLYTDLKDMGIILNVGAALTLALVAIMFVGMLQVTDFLDGRTSWNRSRGVAPRKRTELEQVRWQDEFRLRFGSLHQGTKMARLAMVRYFFLTSMILLLILMVVDSVLFDPQVGDMQYLSSGLTRSYQSILINAIPLVAARYAYGFYHRGSLSKLCSGLAVAALGMNYTYHVLLGGKVYAGADPPGSIVYFSLDISGILALFLIGWMIFATSALVEYHSYRKLWLRNGMRPVDVSMEEELVTKKIMERWESRGARYEAKLLRAQQSEPQKPEGQE